MHTIYLHENKHAHIQCTHTYVVGMSSRGDCAKTNHPAKNMYVCICVGVCVCVCVGFMNHI